MNAEEIAKAIIDSYSNTETTTISSFMSPRSREAIKILEESGMPTAPNHRIAALMAKALHIRGKWLKQYK